MEAVLRFEATRILLKHPYQRRKENAPIAYAASNVTLQEYLQTALPFTPERGGLALLARWLSQLLYSAAGWRYTWIIPTAFKAPSRRIAKQPRKRKSP